ncbi:MAG: hypothetical protein ACO37W_05800 [Prochlorotrichaceae cyanobacterium]
MIIFWLHFWISLLGSGSIFLIFFRLSEAQSTSAPFGLVFLAIACGILAVYLSPWATPIVLLVYGIASLQEYLDER